MSFEQQLQKLIERGLVINDKHVALNALTQISYYRLSAYWYPFRQRDKKDNKLVLDIFEPSASMEETIKLYEFDRQLRLLVVDAIERIEVMIRTKITYHFGHRYGAFGHIQQANFHNNFNHAAWLSNVNGEVSRSKEEFIKHYQTKYDGFPVLPIWILTETMSLGALSMFYKGMINDDKASIARELNVHYKCLSSWLHMLTYIRNICAHHSRLWNRELAIKSEHKPSEKYWLPPSTPRNDRLFYVLLVLHNLLSYSNNHIDWKANCEKLLMPITANRRWQIAMGMPDNWIDHPVWK